jgi:hypothetical protein
VSLSAAIESDSDAFVSLSIAIKSDSDAFVSLSAGIESDSDAFVSLSAAIESDSDAFVSLSIAIKSDSDAFVSLSPGTESHSDSFVTSSVAVERREDESESFTSAIEGGQRGSVCVSASIRCGQEAAEEARAAAPKTLVNTDGETFLMTTDHFEFDVAKRAVIKAKLRAIEWLQADDPSEADSRLTFYKPGNAIHAHWENTVLGHVTLEGDRLRLETNSIERAGRLRARVETGCGGLLRHRAREHADPLSSARPRSRVERESAPPPPEAEEARSLRGSGWAHGARPGCVASLDAALAAPDRGFRPSS